MIERGAQLPVTRQVELLELSRASVYYVPRPLPCSTQVATDRSPLALVGAGLALASFVVTVTVNVPLNNALARAVGDGGWPRFARRWGRANLLRAALSAAGAACLAASLSDGG